MTANLAPARRAALHILQTIQADKGNSDVLLHGTGSQGIALHDLSQLDRNLCTTLVLGTLRWQIFLDAKIRQHLAQPTIALPGPVALALRLGAFQLLFLDRIPVHAVIFESVEWVKHSDHPRASGMVNAVLRKLAALPKSAAIPSAQAYPDWILQRWRKNYGGAATEKICAVGQQEAPATLRLFDPHAAEELQSEGVQLAPGALLTQARIVLSGDASSTRAVKEGRAQFQDEGSQLVAELLGVGQNCGQRILDSCAAPGGKTAILLSNNAQASVVACDISAMRLKAMRQRLARPEWRERIEFHVADASRLPEMGLFDRILCDAPCSGTGTLARNPEIRHRLQLEDIQRQAARQRSILASLLRRLAPGGRLLYATCSLEPEENEEVVRSVLAADAHAHSSCAALDLRAELQDRIEQGILTGASADSLVKTGTRSGFLRTLPGLHPCDGFFAALIERKP